MVTFLHQGACTCQPPVPVNDSVPEPVPMVISPPFQARGRIVSRAVSPIAAGVRVARAARVGYNRPGAYRYRIGQRHVVVKGHSAKDDADQEHRQQRQNQRKLKQRIGLPRVPCG